MARLSGGPRTNSQFDDSPFEINVRDDFAGKRHEWRLRFPRAYFAAAFGSGRTGVTYYISMDAKDREPTAYVSRRERSLSESQRAASPVRLSLNTFRPESPAVTQENIKRLLESGCEMTPTGIPELLFLRARDGSSGNPRRCGITRTIYLLAAPAVRPDLKIECDPSPHASRPTFPACRLDGYVYAGWSVQVDFAATELPEWRRLLRNVSTFLADHTVSNTSNLPSTELQSLIGGVR